MDERDGRVARQEHARTRLGSTRLSLKKVKESVDCAYSWAGPLLILRRAMRPRERQPTGPDGGRTALVRAWALGRGFPRGLEVWMAGRGDPADADPAPDRDRHRQPAVPGESSPAVDPPVVEGPRGERDHGVARLCSISCRAIRSRAVSTAPGLDRVRVLRTQRRHWLVERGSRQVRGERLRIRRIACRRPRSRKEARSSRTPCRSRV